MSARTAQPAGAPDASGPTGPGETAAASGRPAPPEAAARDRALRAAAGTAGPGDRGGRIVIVDYGMGNRRSVEKALHHVGAAAEVTAAPDAVDAADGLVLCGVGAFPAGAERLDATDLADRLRDRVAAGVPLLGICLGMQLLFDGSEEQGGATGLGLLPGTVRRLEPGTGLKTPHIGWNVVRWRPGAALAPPSEPASAGPAAAGGASGAADACEAAAGREAYYHVHSYVARPAHDGDVVAHGDYGGPFVSAVQRGRVHGVQFHPEKSSTAGLRVLAAFVATCVRSPA